MSYSKGEKPVLAKLAKKFTRSVQSRSRSAPSIVNLGSSQVKFEPKVKTAIVSPRKVRRNSVDPESMAQEEIVLLQNEDGEIEEELINLEMSDLEIEGGVGEWVGSEEELSRQASSYITENTEDSLGYDNRVSNLVLTYTKLPIVTYVQVHFLVIFLIVRKSFDSSYCHKSKIHVEAYFMTCIV